LGGFVIWEPAPALMLFGTAGLAIWGLDEFLFRLQGKPAA